MRIKLLVQGVNMGNSHDGLLDIAKEWGVKAASLSDQDVVMFINKKRNRLKVIGHGGAVIGYLKTQERISLDAIKWIPATFHKAGRIDYDAALKISLEATLAKKEWAKHVSPLQAARTHKERVSHAS